ncbi:MAG TPA: GNAT family N-acetyltransferase [Chitinophagaceae bacterium]|nr:GNAT family N-acetyltransferase [Chitinophagaceae bacterium]
MIETVKQTGSHKAGKLYEKHFSHSMTISIHPFNVRKDTLFIHEWVNQDYAKRFWQMDGRTINELKKVYRHISTCHFAQSFMARINYNRICQLDLYHAPDDEVSLHYNAQPGDYGIHVLMAPRQQRVPGLSVCVLQTFLEYFFSFPDIERIIGEPDAENHRANQLVQKLGFRFMKTISMSYKTANLYTCTRNDFINQP